MSFAAKHRLETAIGQAWPPPNWRDSHVVVAVSGGPDSVALLRALLNLKLSDGGEGRLYVAHLHHGLRGAAADLDVAWLEELCRRWSLPLEIGQADVVAASAEQGDGWESAARQARYGFLVEVAEKYGARFVAVGHTADDQVETVLHHILRGTGLAGVAGMPRFRPLSSTVALVRPLLDVFRREVIEYLHELKQDYRTDATNSDNRWTRNWLRNELLPVIRAHVNEEADQALLRLAKHAEESQHAISQWAAKLVPQCATVGSQCEMQTLRIDRALLAGQPPLIVGEVCKMAWQQAGWPLQAMGFEQWRLLATMVADRSTVKALTLPEQVRVRSEGATLVLERRDAG